MTILTVTLDFSVDDGLAAQFVSILDTGNPWPSGSYDGAEGNPAGSMTSAQSYPDSGLTVLAVGKTLIDWGVPAGATINSVGNLRVDYKAAKTGSTTYGPYPTAEIRKGDCLIDPGNIIAANYPPDPFTGIFDSWEALPQQDTADLSPFDTSTVICVDVYFDGDSSGSPGDGIQYWYDNIKFDVDYTAGVDVDLVGGVTQASQTVSGTLTFTEVDLRLLGGVTQAAQTVTGGLSLDGVILLYGGVIQAAQRVYGTLLLSLTGVELEPAPAGQRSVLLLDGVEVPLLQAQVYRQPQLERATAVIPTAFLETVMGSTSLELRLLRPFFDGSGTEIVTLFSGTINLGKIVVSNDRTRVPAMGLAVWPARQNRRLLGKPMYQREDEYASTVRGAIDARLVPGDVLSYGDREMWVEKVVFNLDSNYQFMEASSGF